MGGRGSGSGRARGRGRGRERDAQGKGGIEKSLFSGVASREAPAKPDLKPVSESRLPRVVFLINFSMHVHISRAPMIGKKDRLSISSPERRFPTAETPLSTGSASGKKRKKKEKKKERYITHTDVN